MRQRQSDVEVWGMKCEITFWRDKNILLVVVVIWKKIRKANGFPDILVIQALISRCWEEWKRDVYRATTVGATVEGVKDKSCKFCFGLMEMPRG